MLSGLMEHQSDYTIEEINSNPIYVIFNYKKRIPMIIKTSQYVILTTVLLFCIIGCTRDTINLLSEHDISSTMDEHDTDAKMTFEQTVQPILTEKCALSGCHVDGGINAHGIDLTSYETFIDGGEHGTIFVPGNAEASQIVKEIVSGNMPKGGDKLPDMEVHTIKYWINMQPPQDDIAAHDADHHGDDDDEDDHHEDVHHEDDDEDDHHEDDNEDDHDEDDHDE